MVFLTMRAGVAAMGFDFRHFSKQVYRHPGRPTEEVPPHDGKSTVL
jgi:hypothetical protein